MIQSPFWKGFGGTFPIHVAAALSPSELRHSALRTQNTSQDKVLTLVKLLLLLYPAMGWKAPGCAVGEDLDFQTPLVAQVSIAEALLRLFHLLAPCRKGV